MKKRCSCFVGSFYCIARNQPSDTLPTPNAFIRTQSICVLRMSSDENDYNKSRNDWFYECARVDHFSQATKTCANNSDDELNLSAEILVVVTFSAAENWRDSWVDLMVHPSAIYADAACLFNIIERGSESSKHCVYRKLALNRVYRFPHHFLAIATNINTITWAYTRTHCHILAHTHGSILRSCLEQWTTSKRKIRRSQNRIVRVLWTLSSRPTPFRYNIIL